MPAAVCEQSSSGCRTALDVGLLLVPLLGAWFGLADLGGWAFNDDPFYGRSVQWAVDEGRFELARQKGGLSSSSVMHVAVGYVTCLVAGEFSFRHLFLACILQQWLGAAAIYGAARTLRVGRGLSLLLASVLLLDPIYFGHAFSFMTDGPSTAWIAICLFLAVRALMTDRSRWYLACGAAATWGFWIRQPNLVAIGVPIAVIVFGHWRSPDWSELRRRCGWLLVLPVLGCVLLESGLVVVPSSARFHIVAHELSGIERLRQTILFVYGLLLIVGLMMLPLAPLLWSARRVARRELPVGMTRVIDFGAVGSLLLASTPFVLSSGRTCLTNATGMFLQNGHFGPVMMSDWDEPDRWGTLGDVAWPMELWQGLTLASLGSVGLLVWWAIWSVQNWWRSPRDTVGENFHRGDLGPAVFAAAGTLVAFYLWFVDPIVDRYWLPLLPMLLVWVATILNRSDWKVGRLPAGVSMLVLAAFLVGEVVFLHDLLAWNKVRWQQVERWLDAGYTAADIDGGVEPNAWLRLAEDPASLPRPGDDSRWWSGFATRAVASGPRKGWHEVDRLPWSSWAINRTQYVLVLEKDE